MVNQRLSENPNVTGEFASSVALTTKYHETRAAIASREDLTLEAYTLLASDNSVLTCQRIAANRSVPDHLKVAASLYLRS